MGGWVCSITACGVVCGGLCANKHNMGLAG